jgi:hypothetical protein
MSAPLREGLRGRGSWGWDRSREEGQPRGGIQPRTADGKKYPTVGPGGEASQLLNLLRSACRL